MQYECDTALEEICITAKRIARSCVNPIAENGIA